MKYKRNNNLEYILYTYKPTLNTYIVLKVQQKTIGALMCLMHDMSLNLCQLKKDILNPDIQFGTNNADVDRENNKIIIVPLLHYEGEDTGREFITTIDELVDLIDQWDTLLKQRPAYILVYRDLDNTVHFIPYSDIKDMPTLHVLPSTHTYI